ncbi:MAG TPA: hypothetical protein VNY27_08260 [Solirubrobacteraceae bacterium]|jgi:hypothetical protein|nr:hypothetical protein [Solirubrobacteraceae bacterium]
MSSHTQMIVRAADLAELIVDEISQSDQDWSAIELHARELLELLARQAAPPRTPARVPDDHGARRPAGPPLATGPCAEIGVNV